MKSSHHQTKPLLGSFAALGCGVSGGICTILWLYVSSSALLATATRGAVGACITGLILAINQRSLRIPRHELKYVIGGGIIFALSLWSWIIALRNAPVYLTLIFTAIGPAFIAILERLLFNVQLRVRAYVCIGIASVAVSIAAFGAKASEVTTAGILLCLLHMACDSIYGLYTSRVTTKLPIARYMFGMTTTMAVVLSPLLIFARHLPPLSDIAVLAAIAVIGGSIGWGLFHLAQHHISTGVGACLTLISIPIATTLAWLIKDQRSTVIELVSGAVVLASIIGLTLSPSNNSDREPMSELENAEVAIIST